MRNGLIFSSLLHTTVIVLMVFGLPSLVDPVPFDPSIPVELVVLEAEELTPEPEPEEPKAEEEAPEPKPPPTKQTPLPQPKPAPVAEAEAVPEPIAALRQEDLEPPEPLAAPVPLPAPKPEPEPEPEPEKVEEKEPEEPPVKEPPQPKRRPQQQVAEKVEKKEPEEPKTDRLASILKNVEKRKEKLEQRRDSTEQAEQQGTFASASIFEQREIVQIIQNKMRSCWRVEPGARDAASLIVEIRLVLNQDGSVRKAEVVDVDRMLGDPFFRSAAENAQRAILKCSPFGELPIRKYSTWREINLKFDPRSMFGTL